MRHGGLGRRALPASLLRVAEIHLDSRGRGGLGGFLAGQGLVDSRWQLDVQGGPGRRRRRRRHDGHSLLHGRGRRGLRRPPAKRVPCSTTAGVEVGEHLLDALVRGIQLQDEFAGGDGAREETLAGEALGGGLPGGDGASAVARLRPRVSQTQARLEVLRLRLAVFLEKLGGSGEAPLGEGLVGFLPELPWLHVSVPPLSRSSSWPGRPPRLLGHDGSSHP